MNATEKKARKTAKKGGVSIGDLLDNVREAKDAYMALVAIDAKFDKDEKRLVNILIRYSRQHAQRIVDGGKPQNAELSHTINVAERIAQSFDQRFEAIMRDSFVVFDNGMAAVRKLSPEILVRDADKIIELQGKLRSVLSDSGETYEEIIEAYKAMMAYLPSVSQEAGKALEVMQEDQRSQRRASIAREVLAELEDLDFLE
jgi:hypothetical protein